MTSTETLVTLLVGLAVAVGLVGMVVPVLPGSALIGVALIVWAAVVGGPTAWAVTVVAVVVLAVGAVGAYVVPGRRLQRLGVPASTQWWGALAGVVGFFVVPVVGLPLGFVAGVYLAELHRVGSAGAWPSTRHALRAVGLGMLVELTGGVVATVIWLAGVALEVAT